VSYPPPYRPQPYQPGQYYPPQPGIQPYLPRAVQQVTTTKTLHPAETLLHLILTCCTFGLWGIVWGVRLASRRRYATWQ
jgi:hypothetical protein